MKLQDIKEEWEGEQHIKKLDKYGKDEMSSEDLKSQIKELRNKEERTPAQSKKLKQLNFADRSRKAKGGKWKGVKAG